MKRLVLPLVTLAACFTITSSAGAFCGFYVAKADVTLFNQASQVVLARNGDRTVITMVNDFRGDPKEFAVVIPVPTRIERGQIHVTEKRHVQHLDAYTSPRLVEYFDGNPCMRYRAYDEAMPMSRKSAAAGRPGEAELRANSLGVTIEASYTVGEYDILILSAGSRTASRPGSKGTAIGSRPARRACSEATSNRTCAFSSPR